MRNNLVGSVVLIGAMGLALAGIVSTSARADDDYRYIPNDHRPLTFRNDDGSLHYRSNRRSRRTQRRRSSEPSSQSSERAPRIGRPDDRRDPTEQPAHSGQLEERHEKAERSAENSALICPVTGDKIDSVQDAVGQSTFNGKTYYFCCAGCKPRFEKDPAKFIKNAAAGKFEKM